jgi:hypothetical protein
LRNNGKRKELNFQIRNCFSVLTKFTTASVKKNCNIAKIFYLKTCEDVTGYKNNTKQEWISEKTWDEIT